MTITTQYPKNKSTTYLVISRVYNTKKGLGIWDNGELLQRPEFNP